MGRASTRSGDRIRPRSATRSMLSWPATATSILWMVPPTFTVTTAGRRVVRRSRVRPAASVVRISARGEERPLGRLHLDLDAFERIAVALAGQDEDLGLAAGRRKLPRLRPGARDHGLGRAATGGSGVGSGVGGASGARGPESRNRPQAGAAIRTRTDEGRRNAP